MAQSYGNIFQRVEKKYLLTQEQHNQLLDAWKEYLEPDLFPHSKISNIYFDTEDDELIRRSIDGPRYKEKLRLRTYGEASLDGASFLEIKKKYKGVVYKRRIMLPLREAKAYLEEGEYPDEDSQILHEIDYFLKWYHPIPKLFLSYERDSFRGIREDEVRITFDTDIQSRRDELQLEKNLGGKPLNNENLWIMEVKVSMAYPLWLTNVLADLHIYPTSFSKYGQVYKNERKSTCNITD